MSVLCIIRQFLPKMALGILDPLGKKKTQKLRNFFWDVLSIEKIYQKENISGWVVEQDQLMAETGMTEEMRTQFQLLLLWASQANTGPAASWLLAYLLKHPEAMKAVREEVYNVLKETGQEVEPGGPLINVTLAQIKTPLLDSAVEETLRLRASPFLFRSVLQDMDLKMDDGREYFLRKGDQLLLFPFVGLHMDPEIHPDPHTFKYDRFLNPDGPKKEFSKNGKKLKYHSMPWGAGPSMCPGRFFAISEMKLFVILMLLYFDMELVNVEEEIPPVDVSRYGFGTTHPSCDIQFRYRLRFLAFACRTATPPQASQRELRPPAHRRLTIAAASSGRQGFARPPAISSGWQGFACRLLKPRGFSCRQGFLRMPAGRLLHAWAPPAAATCQRERLRKTRAEDRHGITL
ncbi:7-alpha-hydroxycholest-4-en-3-one 12-alpha-hydroxylase-like [Hemicordylus capensis]|uniref:7-alpha-hydroxycholest-4-en-3-one 12-alpha-hydroxylase-like n=1 Tax=Hemicordylus capensis TaxID=884348 RepID=UPI0023036E9B|nr:7-alpha-hydroxycholest-4-en-3-one 12-alpha-hydroxylase-like [Hemicordylus capensis]